MTGFKRLSIKYKLIVVILLNATISLSIATTAFLSYDQMKQRKTLVEEMQILSQVIALRSAVALSFGDKNNALATLSSLNIRKNMQLACIYDRAGEIFVSTSPITEAPKCPTLSKEKLIITSDDLAINQDIKRNNETIGYLYVKIGLEELYERIWQQLLVSVTMLLISLFLAYLFTRRLQRQIYQPIIDLGEVATQVTRKRNYSIRASKETKDELGDTVDAFNEMLSQIEDDKRQLYAIAYYDHLTKLPNRKMFASRLEKLVSDKNGLTENEKIGVFFLDLDKFKEVNDTLGHDVGDLLLTEFAKRLTLAIPGTATAYRLGGDEFTVIQTNIRDENEVKSTADSILKVLKFPLTLGEHNLTISTSIGIVTSDGNDTVTTLMKCADIALYEAKAAGRSNYKVFGAKSDT